MKLATFNLFQFVAPGHYWYDVDPNNTYSEADWQRKQAWISQQLQAMDADVVGFQEVFSVDALRDLCRQAGYEHFATLGEPHVLPEDERVYDGSVVALAARYPLQTIRTVALNAQASKALRLPPDFRFSRLPVCAEINYPGFDPITVYVVHLKSKRPETRATRYEEQVDWEARSCDTLLRLSRGSIASLYQRGAEATLLYHSVSADLQQHKPVVVLGDMNDESHSVPLQALTMQRRVFEIGGIERDDWPDDTKSFLHDYRLTDSFTIAPNMSQLPRPFTHIHRGRSHTIDYVLVSNLLNQRNHQAQAMVAHYQVWHDHLNEDGTDNRLQSDHAPVCVELLPLRDLHNLPDPDAKLETSISSDLSSRQDFIDLGGGVYQSAQHYHQWSSSEKYDHFWRFFFDENHGWVRSVYGQVPLTELRQKEMHSIEHLIPLNFLDNYLGQQHAPRHVRYGAGTNPFNMAPSERNLNAKRSSFNFDMDGDKVVRPYSLELSPDNLGPVGLDKDDEWVIPTRSRGYVARSLLYMLLVYGIDELYEQHIDTLVHWAKVDSAADWELAYNDWVQEHLGIRNPLIAKPQEARVLLDSKALMRAMVVKES